MASAFPPSYRADYSNPYDRPGNQTGLPPPPPSPPLTQEEVDEENAMLFDWKSMLTWRFWLRKKWIPWYLLAIVLVVLTALMTIFHTQIVAWLTPAATWMRDLPAGWTIPVVILFVISFPPLFGHEIVAVLCGVVWGLWIGFGIVALGTFLGEVGNFYAFKYCCHSRSEKHEKSTPWYACLARVVREGGFKIALIARLSAIPGHFTTAVFATCGMSIWVFCLAAALSLPKQFVTVYLGYVLEQSGNSSEPTSSKIVSDVIVAISILITIFAAWYIYHKMTQVRPAVMRDLRRAKRGAYKPSMDAGASQENLWSSGDFNASEMTLTDPSKGGMSGKPYAPYGREDVTPLFAGSRPSSSNDSPSTLLPPGAAPPAGYASGSGRNTPDANGGAGGRRYAPPSQAIYGASTDDLPMEPIRPAPSSLDQGYMYNPPPGAQRPQQAPPQQYMSPRMQQGRLPPPGQGPYAQAPQQQSAYPPQPQGSYPPHSQGASYAQPASYPPPAPSAGELRNPFDDNHSQPAYMPAAQPVPAPMQPQPQQQGPQVVDAPFPTMMVAQGQGDRPRGVQLRDG